MSSQGELFECQQHMSKQNPGPSARVCVYCNVSAVDLSANTARPTLHGLHRLRVCNMLGINYPDLYHKPIQKANVSQGRLRVPMQINSPTPTTMYSKM